MSCKGSISPTVSERLGTFAARLAYEDLPVDVVDKAKACLEHGLTVGAAGRVTPIGAYAENAIGDAAGPARLLTSGRRVPAQSAALVNSALFHARAQEDTYGTAHLGTVLIPAAIAIAEEVGADGRDLLCGVVAGYEVAARLASRFTAASSARGFRASAVYGPFAAAAAAGRILGSDADGLARAFAYAAAFAGGTLQSFAEGTPEWQFQNGVAASNGLYAARLAAAGAPGAPRAVEGDAGFLAAVAGTSDGGMDLAADLGSTWEIGRVTFKLFPVCAFNQTPAALAARLVTRHDLAADEIERVSIAMNAYEAGYPGMAWRGPFETPGQTLMSTRFTVATALIRRNVTYASLTRYDDPQVLSLVERIDVEPEPGRPQMTARMELRMGDGRVLEDAINEDAQTYLSWGFDRSRSMADRVAAETGMSTEALDALHMTIGALEDGPAASVLDPLLAGVAELPLDPTS